MYLQQFLGLALSALLTINTGFIIHPAITWLNNSSLNITIGSSVNYYFDLEYNEWYPVSGSVDTGGTGRCDTNIIIGNGTDPMTGFIQYERSSVTRGTNLISYDENVAVTSDMIYFYNVSSFTLTTFTSTDTGDLNQPTFTVTFTDGYIWDERDASDLYSLVNLMQANISNISTNTLNTYNQLSAINSNIADIAVDVDGINTKAANMLALIAGEVVALENLYNLEYRLKNYQIEPYQYEAYMILGQYFNKFSDDLDTTTYRNIQQIINRSKLPFLTGGNPNANYALYLTGDEPYAFLFIHDGYTRITGISKYTDGSSLNTDFKTVTSTSGTFKFKAYTFNPNNLNVYGKFNFADITSNGVVLPIYFGLLKNVPDDIAILFGIDKYADTTSAIDQANSELESAAGTEEAFSQQTQQNFTNQIGQINTTDSVVNNSSFQRSANWVATQFNNLTNNNAFGSILGFSLLLGLAMAIIGRVIK